MGLVGSISPRRDVLDGELTDARFAASLEDVAGTAPSAYGTPSVSCVLTYPSGGLEFLLNDLIGLVRARQEDRRAGRR